jgi:O-antigen/teichoic acid export membrane protein
LIKKILNKISTNEFLKGATTLASGTIISQVIPFIIAPVVSRLYSPSDYALLASFSAITALFVVFATGMYDSALMIDKTDDNAVNTGSLAILLTVIVSSISLVLIFILKLFNIKEIESVGYWIFLIPLSILFQGGYQTFNVWNNRKGRYKRLANNRIITSTITAAATVLFGYYKMNGVGLLLSLILGQVLSFLILSIQTYKEDHQVFKHISKQKVKESLIEHKDFPLYNLPQGFLDSFKESSLVWIISFYFGPTTLGAFSFAKSIIMRPLQIINGAVGQVFYQRASNTYNNDGDLITLSKKTFKTLLFIGFPFTLIIFFFGQIIFTVIFGEQWQQAGSFAENLILWLFISFIASPFGSIPIILKQQKNFFKWSILYNVFPILTIYIFSIKTENLMNSIIGYVVSNIIIMITILIWIFQLLKSNNLYKKTNAGKIPTSKY